MPRVPYLPVEIPFILGLDQNDFPDVTGNGQKLYLGVYAWCWMYGKTGNITKKRLKVVSKNLRMGPKSVRRSVLELCEKGFFVEDDDGYNIPKLKEKRDSIYSLGKAKSVPKDSSNVPKSVLKPKETKRKENKAKRNGEPLADFSPFWGKKQKKQLHRILSDRNYMIASGKIDRCYDFMLFILELDGIPFDTVTLQAFIVDSIEKDNRAGWLYKVLTDGTFSPSDKSLTKVKGFLEARANA